MVEFVTLMVPRINKMAAPRPASENFLRSRTIVPARTCPGDICRLHFWLSTLKSGATLADIPSRDQIVP